MFRLTGLVRFVPRGRQDIILIGEPLDPNIDVGEEVRSGNDVKVKVFSGTTVLDFGSATGTIESIDRILSPLAMTEVGSIRCIGLNVSIGSNIHTIGPFLIICSMQNMQKRQISSCHLYQLYFCTYPFLG